MPSSTGKQEKSITSSAVYRVCGSSARSFGYRVQPYEMAQMVRGVAHDRNGQWAVYGHPAGKRKQLHQVSWESDLRAHGVPLSCLPENPFAQRY